MYLIRALDGNRVRDLSHTKGVFCQLNYECILLTWLLYHPFIQKSSELTYSNVNIEPHDGIEPTLFWVTNPVHHLSCVCGKFDSFRESFGAFCFSQNTYCLCGAHRIRTCSAYLPIITFFPIIW